MSVALRIMCKDCCVALERVLDYGNTGLTESEFIRDFVVAYIEIATAVSYCI